MSPVSVKSVALIVAHPDDETLWAGGTLLHHPSWQLFVVCVCRASDEERAMRFRAALARLQSDGAIGDLDDGVEQIPLKPQVVEAAILDLLPQKNFDLIITHSPHGEYTKHLRHEEVGKAVLQLWLAGKIQTPELWTFAYEDGGRKYFPKAIESAPIQYTVPPQDWLIKYDIITQTYGFKKNSWEAKTTPRTEAFHRFFTATAALTSMNQP